MSREFVTFVVAGGVAAAVNWLSRIALSSVMTLELSVVIAYLIGMVTAYALNRLFVFAASGRTVSDESVRFTLVNIVALAQVWLVTIGLVRFILPAIGWDWHAASIAHAVGVASPILTSYLGHRHFTFSKKADAAANGQEEP
ncbi:GtrA family protein [uncultured Maricaulis sp.]|uniref:GtrA family protein n=1 Tax=uncultured Maricaulis sp. TaxID=174710 RepID=UPI0030D8DD53|tara:strand:- start:4328 stop:4753 length:426 start_codon:yes stop_codon:yes gene_type:complete